ncbi:transposase IS116/IS110/IS902 family protein [Deinococcus aerius]|uniref:Transposase IS116/IS110/IS902 family protein n=1 Tax=Deinococcus aerius TaxID=200253 RepID=A0A2I9D243_9DEIO|nr:transposase IS116/IS110/IS902 family protein [Deinococcus aerius]
MLVTIWHTLSRRQPDHGLGGDSLGRNDRERAGQRLVRRLEQMGYAVNLEPRAAPGTA